LRNKRNLISGQIAVDVADSQSPEVAEDEHGHSRAQRVDGSLGQVPVLASILVQSEEHRKANVEVNGVEESADLVHSSAVREVVVRNRLNGPSLHESDKSRAEEHVQRNHNDTSETRRQLSLQGSDAEVGENVVGLEVGLSQHEHNRRDLIQHNSHREGVRGTQQ
jgi:hypothetical protein